MTSNHEEGEPEEASASKKRKRQCPAKMTDFVVHTNTPIAVSTLSENAELMRQFFETLDVVKNAVKSRFDQNDINILKAIERFILSAANKEYTRNRTIC